MEDHWVKDTTVRCLQSTRPDGCNIGIVKEWMNLDKVGWNISLLHNLFSAADVQAINNTPVSSLGLSDRLVWSHTTSGHYSVNSGYKFAKGTGQEKEGT